MFLPVRGVIGHIGRYVAECYVGTFIAIENIRVA